MPQNRTETGKFRKGSSGNPGGRPKRSAEEMDALEAVKALAPEAVQILQRLLRGKDTPAALKIKIAEGILDRTFGKPKQCADIECRSSGGDVEIVIGGEEND